MKDKGRGVDVLAAQGQSEQLVWDVIEPGLVMPGPSGHKLVIREAGKAKQTTIAGVERDDPWKKRTRTRYRESV